MTETALQVQQVSFQGDTLLAAQDIDQKIWVGVSYVCNGIGLNKSQKDTQIQNVQTDLVLKRGCLKFQAGVFDKNNATIAIMIDYLPLWLAKISITPRMQKETPALVERLIDYQLKAKDVLAAAFLPQLAQQPLQSTNPLLEQAIMRLQQSQQNLINCVMEQGYQLANHEEQLKVINESVSAIEKSLEHDFIYADRWDEVQNEFYHLNSIVDDLRKELQNQTVNKALDNNSIDQMDVVRNIIRPLGEKLHDKTIGYKTTYRKVYIAMNVNWKYRMTRWANLNGCKEQLRKIDLVAQDDRLFELFKVTVAKMLEN